VNTVPDVRFSRVGKHLDVFEESWKADHHEAMALYDFQEFLSEGMGLYDWMTERSQDFRFAVFHGLTPPDSQAAENEKRVFERWLRTATECEQQLLTFEAKFVTVEGAVKFRQAVAHVRKFLAEWVPPAVSLARGLRVRRLTAAEVEARKGLLNTPTPSE
jgi:hypothetical protein